LIRGEDVAGKVSFIVVRWTQLEIPALATDLASLPGSSGIQLREKPLVAVPLESDQGAPHDIDLGAGETLAHAGAAWDTDDPGPHVIDPSHVRHPSV
jgi:hypothetical protein